jgi:hypothetical protein
MNQSVANRSASVGFCIYCGVAVRVSDDSVTVNDRAFHTPCVRPRHVRARFWAR